VRRFVSDLVARDSLIFQTIGTPPSDCVAE
jgi:hypothetical protein